jgi:hypothetical protein
MANLSSRDILEALQEEQDGWCKLGDFVEDGAGT